MDSLVVIDAEPQRVRGEIVDGSAMVAVEDLGAAIGWTLKDEGLCRGEICVPVQDLDLLFGDSSRERVDLGAIGDKVERPVLVDAQSGVVAIGSPGDQRKSALGGGTAPDFSLPDLSGTAHQLSEWEGVKRLLVVFSSW